MLMGFTPLLVVPLVSARVSNELLSLLDTTLLAEHVLLPITPTDRLLTVAGTKEPLELGTTFALLIRFVDDDDGLFRE